MNRVKEFKNYEKFLANNYFSPRTSLDIKEIDNKVSSKKLTIIIIMKILAFLFTIRAILAVTLPEKVTKPILCEFFHLYGNPTVIHIGLSAGAVCGSILCGIPFQYLIYHGRSRVFEFLNKIKYNKLIYKLNHRQERKFKLKLKIISFLCLQLAPNSVLAISYWYTGLVLVQFKEQYSVIGKYG
jgi:hypothetical protein